MSSGLDHVVIEEFCVRKNLWFIIYLSQVSFERCINCGFQSGENGEFYGCSYRFESLTTIFWVRNDLYITCVLGLI